MLFMTNAQLKYTSFGILTIFIKLIQTTPSDVEAFDLLLPHFTILWGLNWYQILYKKINNNESLFYKVVRN